MKKRTAIVILALAQFVMILDSTVMNVSISEVVADLHTTVSGLQAAITFYTLTMAALMLTGGKIGQKWGSSRAFAIGLAIYGTGSFITGLSQNLAQLMFGWSLVEGLGAILVVPAIAALAAANYKGKERAAAFAIIGGVSGAAAAVGPLIGGFVTTYLSWRYVFLTETVIVIGIILFRSKLIGRLGEKALKIDLGSVLLSATGMAMLVFGMLQSKVWGWVRPLGIPEINGHPIAPFGVSICAYLILGGVLLMIWFFNRQKALLAAGRQPLVDVTILSTIQLRSGLLVLMAQYLITAAVFFVIPVYLQIALGFDALTTGIKILPLSVGVILFSIIGTRMAGKRDVKQVVRIGQFALAMGAAILMIVISPTFPEPGFGFGMFILGSGLGLLASQLGNVNMSAVSEEHSDEVGGLQGTFQNLGSSLGTAVIGSILIASLTTGFVTSIEASTLPSNVKNYISENTQDGVQIVSSKQVQQYAASQGLSASESQQIADIYGQAQITGLSDAMFFVMALALLSLPLSRGIPRSVTSSVAA